MIFAPRSALAALLALSFMASSCAAPKSPPAARLDPVLEKESLDFLSEQQIRASSIAYRLELALPAESGPKQWLSTFLQPPETRTLPFIYDDLPGAIRKNRALSGSQNAAITGVLKDFLPAAADILAGDAITSFNGLAVTSAGHLDRFVREAPKESWITLGTAREGKESMHRLPLLELVRDIPASVDPGLLEVYSGVSLYGEIILSNPLLRFVESEDELAFLIAHEIAHVRALQYTVQAMTREERKVAKIGTRGGSFLAGLVSGTFDPVQAKAHMNTRIFLEAEELAADDDALELMHSAGFDPKAAARVLERMSIEILSTSPDSIVRIHPVTSDRVIMALKKAEALAAQPAPAPFSFLERAGEDSGLGLVPGSQLDHGGLGILSYGLTWKCSFFAKRAGSGSGSLVFDPALDEVCWFVELSGLESAKQAFQRPEFHIEWFSPAAIKVYETDFKTGPGSGSRMSSLLALKKFPLKERAGVWRVRVTLGGRLIDDRRFALKQG